MAHPPASFLRDSVFMSPFSPSCLSLLVPAFCRKPPKLWVPHEVGQNHSEGWSRFTSRAKPITADLPHYHQQERLGFQNQVARAPWGCAIQQEAWVMLHWVTVLRLQQKTWVWGCAAWEHPFLSTMDQSPLCQRAQKKSSGPSAPGATEHNPPPTPSQEEQKAFLLQPAAAEHTEEGDQYLSTITVSFKCPQPP